MRRTIVDRWQCNTSADPAIGAMMQVRAVHSSMPEQSSTPEHADAQVLRDNRTKKHRESAARFKP
ncbi:MAG: hypothetical protein ACREUE_00675 [Panacagrimonas sp.]